MEKEEKISKKEKQEPGEKITVTLEIEPVLDSEKGISLKELRKGDQILVKIRDSRDIARYLATLLGGKKGSQDLPLSTSIEEIRVEEGQRYVLITRFSPGVLGKTILSGDLKVRLTKRRRKIFNLIANLLRRERR
jgi:hypothetical protein